mmetsp:Transcript_55906/g.130903  ORF Transcript_55906/g.130903 Transcript_55906/m.130903 type:complete len:665 (+) Transcript_55906:50-2044(+)
MSSVATTFAQRRSWSAGCSRPHPRGAVGLKPRGAAPRSQQRDAWVRLRSQPPRQPVCLAPDAPLSGISSMVAAVPAPNKDSPSFVRSAAEEAAMRSAQSEAIQLQRHQELKDFQRLCQQRVAKVRATERRRIEDAMRETIIDVQAAGRVPQQPSEEICGPPVWEELEVVQEWAGSIEPVQLATPEGQGNTMTLLRSPCEAEFCLSSLLTVAVEWQLHECQQPEQARTLQPGRWPELLEMPRPAPLAEPLKAKGAALDVAAASAVPATFGAPGEAHALLQRTAENTTPQSSSSEGKGVAIVESSHSSQEPKVASGTEGKSLPPTAASDSVAVQSGLAATTPSPAASPLPSPAASPAPREKSQQEKRAQLRAAMLREASKIKAVVKPDAAKAREAARSAATASEEGASSPPSNMLKASKPRSTTADGRTRGCLPSEDARSPEPRAAEGAASQAPSPTALPVASRRAATLPPQQRQQKSKGRSSLKGAMLREAALQRAWAAAQQFDEARGGFGRSSSGSLPLASSSAHDSTSSLPAVAEEEEEEEELEPPEQPVAATLSGGMTPHAARGDRTRFTSGLYWLLIQKYARLHRPPPHLCACFPQPAEAPVVAADGHMAQSPDWEAYVLKLTTPTAHARNCEFGTSHTKMQKHVLELIRQARDPGRGSWS